MDEDDFRIPFRAVVEKAGWTSSEIREMLANPLFPAKKINGEMMTTPSVLEYYSRPKPPPVKDSEFTIPIGTYAAAMSKTVEEIERHEFPEVRILDGRKYVRFIDFEYAVDNKPRKPAYQHPRYSDDI